MIPIPQIDAMANKPSAMRGNRGVWKGVESKQPARTAQGKERTPTDPMWKEGKEGKEIGSRYAGLVRCPHCIGGISESQVPKRPRVGLEGAG